MMDNVQDIERNLSPQEMEIVRYHRATIAKGEVGRDDAGRPVTVFSNTIQIPDGKFKGKFVTVPGYFNKHMTDDEHELWKQWGKEINAGKWPVYDDPKKADDRAKYIHGIMDVEGDMSDMGTRLFGASTDRR